MPQSVINQAGEVIGTVIDDAEKNPNVVAKDAQAVVHYVQTQGGLLKSINTRTLEKLIAYAAALVTATNGFAQLAIPNNIRLGIVAAAGIVIASQHVSDINSPTVTKGG